MASRSRGVVADRGPDVAEDGRRLAAGLARRPRSTCCASRGRELGGHPVEEHAVEAGAGERAHLRPHRREHEAHAGERLAQLRQRLAHRRQRLLREAGADPEPEPLAVEAELVDLGVDLRRLVAVERHHRDPELERPEPRRRRPPACRGRARPGGRSTTSRHSRARRSAPRAARRPPGRARRRRRTACLAHVRLSSSATHSTCGVCGNMSTGFTRRSV